MALETLPIRELPFRKKNDEITLVIGKDETQKTFLFSKTQIQKRSLRFKDILERKPQDLLGVMTRIAQHNPDVFSLWVRSLSHRNLKDTGEQTPPPRYLTSLSFLFYLAQDLRDDECQNIIMEAVMFEADELMTFKCPQFSEAFGIMTRMIWRQASHDSEARQILRKVYETYLQKILREDMTRKTWDTKNKCLKEVPHELLAGIPVYSGCCYPAHNGRPTYNGYPVYEGYRSWQGRDDIDRLTGAMYFI